MGFEGGGIGPRGEGIWYPLYVQLPLGSKSKGPVKPVIGLDS